MGIYIWIFLILSVLTIAWELRPFQTKYWVACLALMLCIFAGLRSQHVDQDYFNYETGVLYLDEINALSDSPLTYFEPGFNLIVHIANALDNNNAIIIVIALFALLSIPLKCWAILKMSINPFCVLLIYYAQYFLLHDMTQIRIGLASAFFCAGLYFYCRDKKTIFAIAAGLALLFHYSAVFYFLVFFFRPNTFNRKVLLGFLGCSLVLSFIKLPIMPIFSLIGSEQFGKAETYLELVETGHAQQINVLNSLTLLAIFCLGVITAFLPEEFFKRSLYASMLIKLSITSILLLAAFSSVPTIAFRISELFGVCTMFTFYYLRYIIPNRIISMLSVLFLAAIIFYVNLFYGKLLGPYETWITL